MAPSFIFGFNQLTSIKAFVSGLLSFPSFTGNINTFGFGNGIYVIAGSSGLLMTSSDLVTWTVRDAKFTTNTINAVSYGNGTWVAVGNAGTLSYSTDNGSTWTLATSQFTTSNINAVTNNGTTFVAVGDSGKIRTSTNGSTWTTVTSNITVSLRAVTYANSLFVVVGGPATAGNTSIVTSPTGATWTSRYTADADLYRVDYSGTHWVASGSSGRILYSADGFTWAIASTTQTTFTFGQAFGGGRWVVGGDQGKVSTTLTANIATAWSDASALPTGTSNVVTFGYFGGNSKFYGGTAGGNIISSTNGTTWVTETGLLPTGTALSRITNINNVLFMQNSANQVYALVP